MGRRAITLGGWFLAAIAIGAVWLSIDRMKDLRQERDSARLEQQATAAERERMAVRVTQLQRELWGERRARAVAELSAAEVRHSVRLRDIEKRIESLESQVK